MADLANYGDTVLINGFSKDSRTTKLTRISLTTNSGEGQKYDEAWLQDLIMKHPGLLPLAQIESVFEDMVPVCRELPLKAGFVDNVFISPNGYIAIVECKLWRNPEARRKVIAEIVDYASELSTFTYQAFEAAVLAKIVSAAHVSPLGGGVGWNLRKIESGSPAVSEFLSDTGREAWLAAIIAFQLEVVSKQQD